jgi:hypothetical protein
MAEAVVLLEWSTDPGKYADNIQFQTMRKARTMFGNIFVALAKGQSAMVLAKDKVKLRVTKGVTHSEFFERFV